MTIPEEHIPFIMPALEWKEKHGYWSEHPLHPLEDWRSEVINQDTKQGYWGWAVNREEEGTNGCRY